MIKQSDKVIRVGDYYQLESFQDIVSQKSTRKEEIPSSMSIPAQTAENIVTELPTQREAAQNFVYRPNPSQKVNDMTLNDCQSSLQFLLTQPITDEERREIEKLLKQISEVKNNGELPLNQLPKPKDKKEEAKKSETPQQIALKSAFIDTTELQRNISNLQGLKFLQISKLESLVGILLGQIKGETTQQPQQPDQKTKQQIDSLYNNLHTLSSLNNLPGLMQKIASNETKFNEVYQWVTGLEQTLELNRQILEEMENDEMILNQLEQNFKKSIGEVRNIIKQLSE